MGILFRRVHGTSSSIFIFFFFPITNCRCCCFFSDLRNVYIIEKVKNFFTVIYTLPQSNTKIERKKTIDL